MKKIYILFLMTALIYPKAFGSGYQVMLQGNRVTGMGNLGVAMYQDASALFFNPGAMALMDHNSFMGGINFIFASNSFWNSTTENSNYTAKTNNPSGTPFSLYGVWGPKESKWKFGIGVVTPFGSGVTWEEGWMGRDLLEDIRFKAVQIQPTVSYQITDRLGVGGGLSITFGDVRLSRSLFLDGEFGESSVLLEGSASLGYGFNLGVLYKLSEKVDFGFDFRSEVKMKVENGDASFEVPSSLDNPGGIPSENTFNATLPLPYVLSAGLTWHVNEKLDLGTQFDWVGWSAYDSLIFDFGTNTPLLEDARSPRRYEDSWVIHLGGEYLMTENWQLRFGGYYDKTPVQQGYMTPETPDSNRIGLTIGLGYSLGEHFQFDASFLYIQGTEREQTLQETIDAGTYNPTTGDRDVVPGTYNLNAFIPGISVAYKF
jgi:long-chain fatty acid transport protein